MDLIVAILPIALLIYLMTRKNSVPSHIALPTTALITYLLMLGYFKRDPLLVQAKVISGLLTAFTPILIISGAILLFRTMEATGCMKTIRAWLNTVSPNPVAQLMIVGWAFPFLIEGASGFGTPAALAAPILVGLGFAPLKVAVLALIMNSVPVSFGAVGTPTAFGFSQIDSLTTSEILEISAKSALIHGVAALVIPVIALRYVIDWHIIRRNLSFVYFSILGCTVPYVALAFFSFEFPSLVGGSIGLVVSITLAKYRIGLSKDEPLEGDCEKNNKPKETLSVGAILKATLPITLTIAVLIATRLPALGIKSRLLDNASAITANLGQIGMLEVSQSLVITLRSIVGTSETWSLKLLYIPSVIPFALVALITLLLFRHPVKSSINVGQQTIQQMIRPFYALLGALVLVNLLMMGGENAATRIIGRGLAGLFQNVWIYTATYLGALGSFFSGSCTISNLTFGPIQDAIAADLHLDRTTVLAMQSVGGSMGNMVCINNIVAVCSVLALSAKEGVILRRTVMPMVLYGLIAGLVAFFF